MNSETMATMSKLMKAVVGEDMDDFDVCNFNMKNVNMDDIDSLVKSFTEGEEGEGEEGEEDEGEEDEGEEDEAEKNVIQKENWGLVDIPLETLATESNDGSDTGDTIEDIVQKILTFKTNIYNK